MEKDIVGVARLAGNVVAKVDAARAERAWAFYAAKERSLGGGS